MTWCLSTRASVATVLTTHPCVSRYLRVKMLNCFEDYKTYIHIFNPILDLALPILMELTLKQQYMLCVMHSQCQAC